MSRTSDALNRLELAARKFCLSVEDTLLILEGKHPGHAVVSKDPPVKDTAPVPAPAPASAPDPSAQKTGEPAAGGDGEHAGGA